MASLNDVVAELRAVISHQPALKASRTVAAVLAALKTFVPGTADEVRHTD